MRPERDLIESLEMLTEWLHISLEEDAARKAAMFKAMGGGGGSSGKRGAAKGTKTKRRDGSVWLKASDEAGDWERVSSPGGQRRRGSSGSAPRGRRTAAERKRAAQKFAKRMGKNVRGSTKGMSPERRKALYQKLGGGD